MMESTSIANPCVLRLLLVASLSSVVAERGAPQSTTAADGPWAGWARCELTAQAEGYTNQQTHTWVLTGTTPTVEGGFRLYPATWTVTGKGSRQRVMGDGRTVVEQWTTAGEPRPAPISVWIRGEDGTLRFTSRHAQQRSQAAATGTSTARSTKGKAPDQTMQIGYDVYEWTFPAIEDVPAKATTVNGSPRPRPLTGSIAPGQPPGTSSTEACSWQFVQGALALSQPPQPPSSSAAAATATPSPKVTLSAAGSARPIQAEPSPTTGFTPKEAAPDRTLSPNVISALGAPSQPVAPAGFTARHLGGGSVALQWQSVASAVQYRIEGTGVPSGGQLVSVLATTLTSVPGGPGTWRVTSVYPNSFSDPNVVSVASAMVRYLPPHSQPWLSKSNGTGDLATTFLHYFQICTTRDPKYPEYLGKCLADLNGDPGQLWGDPIGSAVAAEAVYGNTNDLGYGRRTQCIQEMRAPPAGWTTMCYVTNHGPGPGESGYADPNVITRAAAGEAPASAGEYKNPWGGMPRTVSVIVKDARGTAFMSMDPGKFRLTSDPQFREPSPGWWWGSDWWTTPSPVPATTFDSEGPKLAPHACLACHGGRWDPTTNRAQGASLLPLDPGVFAFGVTNAGDRTRYERAYQEENIRRINAMVVNSGSSQAVIDYIRGLYRDAVFQVGAPAQADYVPSGWAEQAALYRLVVKPYCANCHLAGPATLSFATWGNFLQNKALIYTAVCRQKTMPHAEIPFREFWTKDTGPVYLPGLLALSLGYQSCP